MSKKVLGLIGLALLAVVSVVFVVGMGGVPSERSQELKHYESKAGFSVFYPASWYLEENTGSEMPRYQEGWQAFEISNVDLDNLYAFPDEIKVEIFFNGFVEDLPNSPSEIDMKLKYFAQHYGMRSYERINIMQIQHNTICVAYGYPRGISQKYEVIMFYLPRTKRIATAIVYSKGEYTIESLLNVIKIEIHE